MPRTISRARGKREPKERAPRRAPLVGHRDNGKQIPARFDDLIADPEKYGKWVKFSSVCRRCGSVHVHCINSGAEITTPAGPECRQAPREVPDGVTAPLKTKIVDGEEVPIWYAPGRAAKMRAKLLSRQDQPGCDWRFAAIHVDSGACPWLVDMPGAYGPGDVFEVEPGERVFTGCREGGEWRELKEGGAYEVCHRGLPHRRT